MKMNLLLTVGALITFGGNAVGMGQEELSPEDLVRVQVQRICPVSGNALGQHGQPFKVKIGELELFLCCQGCLRGEVNRDHWATIHRSFAQAQAICPVMKKELPRNPRWTIVAGKIIYVCCPPCVDEINEESEHYLAALHELYRVHLRREAEQREADARRGVRR